MLTTQQPCMSAANSREALRKDRTCRSPPGYMTLNENGQNELITVKREPTHSGIERMLSMYTYRRGGMLGSDRPNPPRAASTRGPFNIDEINRQWSNDANIKDDGGVLCGRNLEIKEVMYTKTQSDRRRWHVKLPRYSPNAFLDSSDGIVCCDMVLDF
jgi:hypothetical protein